MTSLELENSDKIEDPGSVHAQRDDHEGQERRHAAYAATQDVTRNSSDDVATDTYEDVTTDVRDHEPEGVRK